MRRHHEVQQQQQQQGRKVSVVYYLCNNRHLEHPHIVEVPLSFPEGLYLKDVIMRLNALRGKGMAAMYSWSCKRGYKNGFVWHDIGEDDLILPAHGSEYVLKGSELLDQSPPDRNHDASRIPPPTLPPDEILPFESLAAEPAGCRSSPPSAVCSPGGGVADFRLNDPVTVQNASTQTDAQGRRRKNEAVLSSEATPAVSSSSTMSTLESLIRDECGRRIIRDDDDLRIVEEEQVFSPTRPKLTATDLLVQLITCGSTSAKDHYSFGIVPTYKPRFLKPSPWSPADGADSIAETKMNGEGGEEGSSCRDGDGAHKVDDDDGGGNDSEMDSKEMNCLSGVIKIASSKQSRIGAIKRSPGSGGT